jgi:hypothetical protein
MTVYLLHLSEPMPRGQSPRGVRLWTRHYLGYASRLDERLQHHAAGSGARLLAVARERGIGFECVRTWNGGRDLERRLKRQKNAPRLCPVCGAGYSATGESASRQR